MIPRFLLLLLIAVSANALEGTLTIRPLGGDPVCPYGYLEYLPANYDKGKDPLPVVVSFHGRGGEGNGASDLAKLRGNGPARLIDGGRDFPAVVLCPQAAVWYDVALTHRFITWAQTRYRIDPRRIYLTGYSAGGSQVWNYSHAHPEVPAAIVPICGASDPQNRESPKDPSRLTDIAVWAFHSFDDGTVNRRTTIRWMDGMAKISPGVMDGYSESGDRTAQFIDGAWRWVDGVSAGDGRPARAFTLYATGGHDAWTRTYANEDVWTWLFAQRRLAR